MLKLKFKDRCYIYFSKKRKLINSYIFNRNRKIAISKILVGQQAGIPLKKWVEISGEKERISLPLVDSPYVSFLKEVQRDEKLLNDDKFLINSSYFKLGLRCIKVKGHFLGAKNEDELKQWMKNYYLIYKNRINGKRANLSLKIEDGHSKDGDKIKLREIKDSDSYEIIDGHHRIAINYLMGKKYIEAIIIEKGHSALQDKLLKINIVNKRVELHQPIDKLDVKYWPVIRRCNDRFDMMKKFISTNKIKINSVLDLACSYGWFIYQFKNMGFKVLGIDRDEKAIEIADIVYNITPKETKVTRIENFLNLSRDKYDIVLFLSILHHYGIGKESGDIKKILKGLDKITKKVLFLDTGQNHEIWLKKRLSEWDDNYIINLIKSNTSFKSVIPLGKDKDNRGNYKGNYNRTLFACIK